MYHTTFLQINYRATKIKTIWYWQNNHTEHWNRLKSPEIKPQIYGQLFFDKGAKNTQQREKTSLINDAGRIGKSHAKE